MTIAVGVASTADNPPIASISRATNPLIPLRFPEIQRPQPAIARPAPRLPPFRRREGRRALRSCRGGNGMSGRGSNLDAQQFAGRPSGLKPATSSSRRKPGRAASVRPPQERAMGGEPAPFRGSGSQGSDPPAGGYVGKASTAPLVLRGSRPFRPTATGQTSRAERRREAETHSPTVSGLRARRSAGPSLTVASADGEESCAVVLPPPKWGGTAKRSEARVGNASPARTAPGFTLPHPVASRPRRPVVYDRPSTP